MLDEHKNIVPVSLYTMSYLRMEVSPPPRHKERGIVWILTDLLCQMSEGAYVEQFFEVGLVLHIEDDVLRPLDLGVRQDPPAIFAVDVHGLVHCQRILRSAVGLIHRSRQCL